MIRHSIKPREIFYVKSYGVLSFARIFEDKYSTKRIDTPTKTVTGILKSA